MDGGSRFQEGDGSSGCVNNTNTSTTNATVPLTVNAADPSTNNSATTNNANSNKNRNGNNQRGNGWPRGGGGGRGGSFSWGAPNRGGSFGNANAVSPFSASTASTDSASSVNGSRGGHKNGWRGRGGGNNHGRGRKHNNNKSSSASDPTNNGGGAGNNDSTQMKRGRSESCDEEDRPMSHGGGVRNPRPEHEANSSGKHHHHHHNNNSGHRKHNNNNNSSNPKSGGGGVKTVLISGPIRNATAVAQPRSSSNDNLNTSTDSVDVAEAEQKRQQNMTKNNNNRNRHHHNQQSGDQNAASSSAVAPVTHSVGVDTSDCDESGDVSDDTNASPRFLDRQAQPRFRNSVGTNTTPQTRPRDTSSSHQQSFSLSHQHQHHHNNKRRDYPPVLPTPDGVSPLQDPTVFVSPYVRVVAEGEDNSTTIRTLESLLKYGTAGIGMEDDTPFLGPNTVAELPGDLEIADLGAFDGDDVALITNNSIGFPSQHRLGGLSSASGSSNNLSRKPPSPGLQFSLDGVATPNTWGAIDMSAQGGHPQLISLPPATDPHTGGVDFSSGLSINVSISTPESSMYRFLINDYCREKDTFRYRTAAPELKAKFMQRITDLCVKVTSILEQECLMCAVSTPVYVLGDIHGNFCDLSYFLKSVLAFNDIHLSPCNILCLGDYVDRGPFSLECILLLLALKATAPAKVTLLRGNHEDRVVCGDRRTYGNDCFLAQCQNIFGAAEGMNVFIMVTEVFRHLPLAAEIVIANAPNNPQAPRDLADEDDWESVPNNSMAGTKSGLLTANGSGGVVGMTTPMGSMQLSTSPNVAMGESGMSSSSASRGGNNNGISLTSPMTPETPEKKPIGSSSNSLGPAVPSSTSGVPKTPKNAFRVEQNGPRDVRKMFTDRNWLRRQTHVERILCTHGGIPRFSGPPKDADSLAFLRSPNFPRLLTLFPNNPLMRDHQPLEVERFRNVSEEVMQRAWFTMFDLMWSDPTVDDSNVNEWGFGINTRGNTVVSFSAKAVETFLDAYKYSMLFRAHQEKAHGIRLSKSKKVLTIFSTSNYLGHGNGAGCAVVSPYGEVQLIVKTSE